MAIRYTKTSQTGDEGIAYVKLVASKAGCIYRPFENADLGIDGALEFINDNREPSGEFVLVQVKSGESYISKEGYQLKADRKHLETWSRYSIPVVGIIYNPERSDARWIDISSHLRHYPECIDKGPYILTAPESQKFTVEEFEEFSRRFNKIIHTMTSIDATPNMLIREWKRTDADQTRVLLTPIANDYPGFYDWLEREWQNEQTSKKVVQIDRSIAAYSMWKKKDDKNIKLQTFFVGPLFRGTATGQHLLFHEIRTWKRIPEIERVYVTISSGKNELVEYFYRFGFRIEGIAARRYHRPQNDAEIVLAKHFIREVIRTPDDLERVINKIANSIWGINPASINKYRFGLNADSFSIPLALPQISLKLNTEENTVKRRVVLIDENGNDAMVHNDESLMREYYPLQIHLSMKRYLLIPIYPEWSRAMLVTEIENSTNLSSLKMRIDNVYYCYPKIKDLSSGDLVIFYETLSKGGRGVALGCALVKEVVIDSPETLFERFEKHGIYQLEDIRKHTLKSLAMAIHFDLFEPFGHEVELHDIQKILKKQTKIQGLTPISRNAYEEICAKGEN